VLPGSRSGQLPEALVPFYDLASVLPYKSINIDRAKLAMKIGGEYRLRNIGLRHWRKLAADVHIDAESLITRIRAMAAAMPDLIATIQKEVEAEGLAHPTIVVLSRGLKSRAKNCQANLEKRTAR
jgi:serine/threonine-protein kinase HipA